MRVTRRIESLDEKPLGLLRSFIVISGSYASSSIVFNLALTNCRLAKRRPTWPHGKE
jgi:hypothetical protein